MSRIIEKAFDATKKIFRSVFIGSPNLITSSDLNRQLEAIKYQLDQLDDKVGVLSDFSLSYLLDMGTISVTVDYSYIEYKGCSFSPEKTPLSLNLTPSAPVAYICLVATKETVTYDTDFTHDIAGAKFADGTSYPAANQLVYKNEEFLITHSVVGVSNLLGILAVMELSTNGNVVVRNNCILKNSSVIMGSSGVIQNIRPELSGDIKIGTSYEDAFSILNNRFNNLCPQWRKLTYLDQSSGVAVEKDTDIDFRIMNGMMYINMLSQKYNRFTSRMGASFVELGLFPSDIRDEILSYFRSLNLNTYNRFQSGGYGSYNFIPFGCFGDFPVYQPYQEESSEPIVIRSFPAFGRAKVCLALTYGSEDPSFVTDVVLGMYIDSLYRVSDLNKSWEFIESPVDWNFLQTPTGHVYIPRFFGVTPLTGNY